MKITMYELLGMIKDGKAPKKIKTGNIIYELDNKKIIWADEIYHEVNKDYIWLNFKHIKSLNDTVEILEEEKKIPEKLEDISEIKCVGCKVEINIAGNKTFFDTDTPIVTEHCIYKINQLIKNQKKIIDYLKSKGE